MYPQFAKEAEEEGNEKAARLFRAIAKVEAEHETRYKRLLQMVEDGNVFKRNKPIRWKCSKCGHIHTGEEPPIKCPSCKHETEYFEPECMCFNEECDICQIGGE